MIRDYKFSGWTIEGTSVDKEMVELADELRNKIIKASKMLDRALYADLKTRLEKGSFYLNNVYHNLSSVFDFYEEKIFSTIKNVKFERGIKKRENNSRS